MGRLSGPASRLRAAPQALAGLARAGEAERLRERDESLEWRRWYKLARWRRLREQVLERDGYVCQRTGVLLVGVYPAPNSPTVDHIVPHRGDPELFWDEDNLQSVAKGWHDSVKQAREHADVPASRHPDWLRPSLVPLTVVCGPPAAGKSHYVAERAGPGELVLDLDVLAHEISGEPVHGWNRDRWRHAALWRRNDLLGRLSRPNDWPAAWLIVSEPRAQWRSWWAEQVQPSEIVVLETPERTCRAQARLDPDRDQLATETAIARWWASYEPRHGDRRIRPSA